MKGTRRFAVFAESLFWSSGLRIAQLRKVLLGHSQSRCCKIEALDRKSSYVWYTRGLRCSVIVILTFPGYQTSKGKRAR